MEGEGAIVEWGDGVVNAEEKSRATELGRKLFEKEARRYDVNPKVVEGDAFGEVLSFFGHTKVDDLFADIGYGKVQPKLEGKQMLTQEYAEGDYYRVFRIDETIDSTKINAECKDGLLTVHLPKTAAVRPRQIAVKSA